MLHSSLIGITFAGMVSMFVTRTVRTCPWYCTNWCKPGVSAQLCNRGECDRQDPLACEKMPTACKETCSEYTPPIENEDESAHDISVELILLPAIALCCTACCLVCFFNRHCFLETFRRGVDSEYVRNYNLPPKEKQAAVARANAQFQANMQNDARWRDIDCDHSMQVDEVGDVEDGGNEILRGRMHRANSAHIKAIPARNASPRRGSNSGRRGSKQSDDDGVGRIAARAVELHNLTLENARGKPNSPRNSPRISNCSTRRSSNSPRISNCSSTRRSSNSRRHSPKKEEDDAIAAIVGRAVELHSWTLEDASRYRPPRTSNSSARRGSADSAISSIVGRAIDLHSVQIDSDGRVVNAIYEDSRGDLHIQPQRSDHGGHQQHLEELSSNKNRGSNSPHISPRKRISDQENSNNKHSGTSTKQQQALKESQHDGQRRKSSEGSVSPEMETRKRRGPNSKSPSNSPRKRQSDREDNSHIEKSNAAPVDADREDRQRVADLFGVVRNSPLAERISHHRKQDMEVREALSTGVELPQNITLEVGANSQWSPKQKDATANCESRGPAGIDEKNRGLGLPEPKSPSGSPRRRSSGRMAAAIDARVMLDNYGQSPRNSNQSPRNSGKSPRNSGKSPRGSRQERSKEVP